MIGARKAPRRRSMFQIKTFKQEDPLFRAFTIFPGELYRDDPFYVAKDDIAPGFETDFFMIYKGEIATGRAAAIINPGIRFNYLPTALMGYYECVNDQNASKVLMDAVCDHLKKKGFQYVIGPMNGSTWQSYRVTETDTDIPFFLDNYNKEYYAQQFFDSGFKEIARFHSARVENGVSYSNRLETFSAYFEDKGLVIRNFNPDRFSSELKAIYDVSLESFKGNFLYTDISFDLFEQMYSQMRDYINPQYVLICENQEGRPLGFLFAIHNILERRKKSLIIKTAAVLPLRECKGVGAFMVEKIHKHAFDNGYDEIIHALMHEKNVSMNVSLKNARVFRNYLLFGKEI